MEIASREFENDLRKLINHPQPKIVEKIKALLKKWVEGDFKTDPQLNLIPSLYNKLKSEGHDFSSVSDTVSLHFIAIIIVFILSTTENYYYELFAFASIESQVNALFKSDR